MSLPASNTTPELTTTPGRVSDTSSTPTLSTPSVPTALQPSFAAEPSATAASSGPNVGLILGVLFGTLAFLALTLFAVRYYYIKRRQAQQQSGARLAYTKAKAVNAGTGRVNISGPTDFRVVESGLDGYAGAGRPSASSSQEGLEWNPASTFAPPSQNGHGVRRTNTMESGLSTHMETMKKSVERKPAPVVKVESVTVSSDR